MPASTSARPRGGPNGAGVRSLRGRQAALTTRVRAAPRELARQGSREPPAPPRRPPCRPRQPGGSRGRPRTGRGREECRRQEGGRRQAPHVPQEPRLQRQRAGKRRPRVRRVESESKEIVSPAALDRRTLLGCQVELRQRGFRVAPKASNEPAI